MSKFIPKLVNEKGRSFVLLDNVFSAEEGISWAKRHRLDVKFTCGTYTCATELLCYLQEACYALHFVRRPLGVGDSVVFDTVYGYYRGD